MGKRFFSLRINVLTVAVLFLLIQAKGNLATAGEANPAWQVEWGRILQAARKEGKVMIYASTSYDRVFREFQKKYPGIKVTHVAGRGSQSAQRILSERRAGKHLADLFLSGIGTGYNVLYKGRILDPVKSSLILPEVVDKSKWWQGKHHYVDNQGAYLFAFNGSMQSYFGYNTKLVNPNEFKSYWDLLDPKWKGKMVSMSPPTGGGGTGALKLIYYTPELGPKFLRRLFGEMDLTFSRDTRQVVDWLAVGKFSISVFTHITRTGLHDAKSQGLPVDWLGHRNFKEGMPLASANGNIGLINRAPHPNAVKVAINWLLSREGQMAFQRFVPGTDSLRIDISKDNVASFARRLKGVKYVDTGNPKWADMEPILKVVNEVMKKKR